MGREEQYVCKRQVKAMNPKGGKVGVRGENESEGLPARTEMNSH
jgi:hypothetical protein